MTLVTSGFSSSVAVSTAEHAVRSTRIAGSFALRLALSATRSTRRGFGAQTPGDNESPIVSAGDAIGTADLSGTNFFFFFF